MPRAGSSYFRGRLSKKMEIERCFHVSSLRADRDIGFQAHREWCLAKPVVAAGYAENGVAEVVLVENRP